MPHVGDEHNFIRELIQTSLDSLDKQLLHSHHIPIRQHALVNSTIAALTQLVLLVEDSCGSLQFVVRIDRGLNLKLFKFLLEVKVQALSVSSGFEDNTSHCHQHYQCHHHCTGSRCNGDDLASLGFNDHFWHNRRRNIAELCTEPSLGNINVHIRAKTIWSALKPGIESSKSVRYEC